MSVMWYDKTGKPLRDYDKIEKLLEDFEYKRIARTEVGPYFVSTVWLGLDHDFSFTHFDKVNPRPVIFETMVFENAESTMGPLEISGKLVFKGGNKYHESLNVGDFNSRYSTLEEAEAGHTATVERLKQWIQEPTS